MSMMTGNDIIDMLLEMNEDEHIVVKEIAIIDGIDAEHAVRIVDTLGVNAVEEISRSFNAVHKVPLIDIAGVINAWKRHKSYTRKTLGDFDITPMDIAMYLRYAARLLDEAAKHISERESK